MRRLAAALLLALLAACNSKPEPPDNAYVCRVFSEQATNREVIARGTVVAVLGLREGPSGEHEGYLLKLNGNCDLMLRVETNVSITGPVPVRRGEQMIVKGVYVFNPMGGILHWTHHDPSGRHLSGYIVIGNRVYS
jgi:hypothetical protein